MQILPRNVLRNPVINAEIMDSISVCLLSVFAGKLVSLHSAVS